jgi:hypothetical protein
MSNSATAEPGSAARVEFVAVEYKTKVEGLERQIASLRERKVRALSIAILCVVLVAALAPMAFGRDRLLIAAEAVPFLASMVAIKSYLRSRRAAIRLAHLAAFYERGIDRMEGNWRGKGNSGSEFARAHHLYQADLDILGEGSLIELLATTRSEVGAERLAAFLLDPPSLEEARARQQAVTELRAATRLREEVALLGKYQFQNCEGSICAIGSACRRSRLRQSRQSSCSSPGLSAWRWACAATPRFFIGHRFFPCSFHGLPCRA